MAVSHPCSFLFASSTSELDSRRQRILFTHWNAAVFLLSSAGITLLSLLLGLGMFPVGIFFDYFRNPVVFLLNWIPVLLLQLVLYGLSGRQWVSYLITSLFVLLLSAASFYKLRFRGEPVLFSDLMLIGAAAGVADDFDFMPNIRLILAALAIPLGTLFLLFFVKARPTRPVRLLMSLIPVLLSPPLWLKVYSDEDRYVETSLLSEHLLAKRWNEMVYVVNGSVYPFLYSITYAFDEPPANYSEKEARELLSAYPEADIPEDRKIDLLVFQLESFCDYTEFGIQGLQPGFYDLYHALEKESFTGDLLVNVIGGGTIDTERCFLTGSTYLFSYTAPSNSCVRVLRSQGYTTFFDHPHWSNFYNRKSVMSYLGFEHSRFRDDYYMDQVDQLEDYWMSDAFLFPEVIDQYLEHASKGEHVFSFTVTTQGHGGYLVVPYAGTELYWSVEGCSETAYNEVNTYFSKLADTQIQLSAAIDRLRDSPYPVAVLVYGDHQARLVSSDEFYDLSGMALKGHDLTSFRNAYTTRYLLWVNDAARELLEDDLRGEGPVTSPCFLMDIVFEKLGWRGSPYMQLSREVRSSLFAVNLNGFYITDDGPVYTLSEKDAALLHKLELTQFYLKESKPDN